MTPKLTLKTKEELDALLLFLDIVEREIFKKDVFNISKLREKWGHYSWFSQIQGIIKQGFSGNYDEKLLIIKGLNKWANGLEQVKLIVPFQPSQEFIDKVYTGLAPSEPSGFVLDVTIDKTITSGGRLFHRGRYIDLTLKSRIESLINKEDAITKYL
jgi:hypothetical protein